MSQNVEHVQVSSEEINQTDKPKNWLELIDDGKLEEARRSVGEIMLGIARKHSLNDYDVLMLHDEDGTISNYEVDTLYSAADTASKNILLIIHSRGGQIEPAYLISKTLKQLSKEKFVVAIPRKAKSAATLISLGADEIHMGHASELGPIDIQIKNTPVLAVSDALHLIADLVTKYPGSADMFGKYLINQAPIGTVGFLKRVGESAVQYAERLLSTKSLGLNQTPKTVADHLVNHYKDHSFVIDIDEATKLLGSTVIKTNSQEYKCASEIHKFFEDARYDLQRKNIKWWYIGSLARGPYLFKSPPKE